MKTIRIVLMMFLALLGACDRPAQPVSPPPQTNNAGSRLVTPEHGLYTGAYMDFGEREDEVTLEKIEAFEQLVGHPIDGDFVRLERWEKLSNIVIRVMKVSPKNSGFARTAVRI